MTQTLEISETALSLHHYRILGVDIQVYDFAESQAAYTVARELARDSYKLRRIPFRQGDCVADIGGHVGLVSITLALLNPFLRIYAYEPRPDNYALFHQNLTLNRVSNNEFLENRGCSPQALRKFCTQRLARDRVTVSFCRMSE